MTTTETPLRAILIANATAGRPEESSRQLAEILDEMKRRQILAEVFVTRPNSRLGVVVRNAVRRGIGLVVVAGGDGTIDSVAGAMAGTGATLGIIPTGTRNNVALSLGIPDSIAEAVALLRDGRRMQIDVGQVRFGRRRRWFLEAATVGLLSDLYPAADDIQHGDLTQIGALLATFFASTPSMVRIVLDGHQRLETEAHMVLIANMPYLGPHFQVAPDVSFDDGLLDVLVYSDMGKMDLMSHSVQSFGGGASVEDDRIKHYRVRQVAIHADPPMPVLADGFPLGLGPVSINIRPRVLAVMSGKAIEEESAGEGNTKR